MPCLTIFLCPHARRRAIGPAPDAAPTMIPTTPRPTRRAPAATPARPLAALRRRRHAARRFSCRICCSLPGSVLYSGGSVSKGASDGRAIRRRVWSRLYRNGDRGAYCRPRSRYERAVRAATTHILRDVHAAQDAAQNANVTAYRTRVAAQRRCVRAWLIASRGAKLCRSCGGERRTFLCGATTDASAPPP